MRCHLVRLLGLKARNQVELRQGLKSVPASSVYYHTHRLLQQNRSLSPEPPNDFAYWITHVLSLDKLGESLASVDTIRFRSVEELRARFVEILQDYLSENGRVMDCLEGNEFHFMACQTFVLPTPFVAHDLRELGEILGRISIDSLYFHIFEARVYLEREENDFSAWCKAIGDPELAREISRLDPYTNTLEGLRQKMIHLVSTYAGS
ncbi:MAG: hypothetical protein HYX88_04225 [Chloroflexi bacterium]|nr:hypothetical protein [Chloroflexota bacterium]